MKEYKVVENKSNSNVTEELLNGYSDAGWIVVGFTQYQILLEREKQPYEEQNLLHD